MAFRDWNEILNKAIIAIQDESIDTWGKLARAIDIPRRTLADGMRREFNIHRMKQIRDMITAEEWQGNEPLFTEYDNKAVVESRSERITSLDQLIEAAKVDLTVWRVDHHIINKWEVGAKFEKKKLTFSDGVIDGTIESDGSLLTEPLWQIKAWLVRIEPIPIFPILQPVRCLLSYEKPPPPKKDGILRTVVWSDPQVGFNKDQRNAQLVPFHDRLALDILVQVVEYLQPDRIDGLGDSLDLAMWTDKFARDPTFRFTTQPAICELHWWLMQLRFAASPNTPIRLHQGNHDARFDKYTALHLEEATDLRPVDGLELPPAMSIQRLLALHELGIEWIGDYPDDEDWLNDYICLAHGDKARVPGSTASTAVRDADYIQVIGHIHRSEMVIRKVHTRTGDRVVICYCVPCLCHTDGRVPGSDKRDQWQKGITVMEYEAEGRGHNVTSIPIEEGRAIFDGRTFTGRDRLPEIQSVFPDWNWA